MVHTLYLILKIKTQPPDIEHEATTSKISDDQLFYCRQRGLNQEEAVSLIVNGFVKKFFSNFQWNCRSTKISWHKFRGKCWIMIEIKNLKTSIEDKKILNGLNLKINKGEVHAIMGPNGSGKSTLSYALSGKEGYDVSGEILFKKKNLLDLNTEERAQSGIFLAFQYPIEIPGVFTNNFLRTSLNSIRKAKNQKELNAIDFLKLVKDKAESLQINQEMLSRPLNVGFSGGEKKRNEILQMALIEPEFVIMDETDSGLDIDALKIVSNGVNALRNSDRSFLIITHYQRLLNYIKPDFVHVLSNGKIVESGDWKLALELENDGYGKYLN